MGDEQLNLIIIGDVPEAVGERLCDRLSEAGRQCRPLRAALIEEGLRYCGNGGCCCIVMSYRDSGGSELGFIESLRDAAGHLRIPIIALSETPDLAAAVRLMKLGVSDYLLKETLNEDDLYGAVEQAIEKGIALRERTNSHEQLLKSNNLLNAIHRIQSKFLLSPNPRTLMDELLVALLSLTDSEFGIIGEVLTDDNGQESLNAFAVSNIAWDDQTRKLFEKHIEDGFKFHNMDNLIGSIIKTGKAVISDDPPNDSRRGGLPEGHPELRSFLGIPMYSGSKLIGLAALANREGGYSEELVEFLQPFSSACGNMIEAYRNYQLRVKAEDDLRELTLSLGDKMRKEAMNRLVQERLLIQQSKMAAMGEMINAIAHQWKQPLNTLALLIQNMEEDLEDNKIDRPYINNVIFESMTLINFMAATVEDFRNFFKPAKEMTAFSAKKAVEDILALIYLQFINRNIDASVECEGDPTIWGYPNEFKQAVLNIVNNARDAITDRKRRLKTAMGRGKIAITIYEEGEYAVVRIFDNGGGIPDTIRHKLFEPYVTTKGDKGTGVGLYMSKNIIEGNMNGRLDCENIKDGACFKIYMPLLCGLNVVPM
ncbi:MAG: GAF domain-containing protein [Candidatus Magnetominusculus sp. LBB02]|nr:GAF domain-containing protein [Candidatus Magnetominusculus sp. LBB02]